MRGGRPSTDVELLLSAGGSPHGVDFDLANGKLYRTEEDGDRIRRADLDGMNTELLLSTELAAPLGISLGQVGPQANVPTLPEWGLALLGVSLLGAGALVLRRRALAVARAT